MNHLAVEIQSLPNPLPFYYKAVFSSKRFREGDAFPELACQWKDFKFDLKRLNKYRQICQIDDNGYVPILYPHSFLGPLHLQIMTHDTFPLKLLGSVHHRNHIVQYRPLKVETNYGAKLRLGEHRRRPQGMEFDLITDIEDDRGVAWSSVSTFLVRKKFSSEDPGSPLAEMIKNLEHAGVEALRFTVPSHAGKSFGLITKDINPIHMSAVMAKVFGFKRDLAHGMWALARGTAPLMLHINASEPIRFDVAFKGPVYMKDQVRVLTAGQDKGHFEFYSGKNDRPSIVGQIKNVSERESVS
ncbi:MaoC/PaaZ C-terminal domain-containing protein [Pseudobacteriovorax antillogorgiicola]|uniref:MaoC like domain-containing protein n=1 Tax=Pseudobacteriovorax antillogorgiicola TaxID=1513793 RepID=A0A1Y6CNR1_9BACT|nr:MaoC/PaaZ C-terminal domain-containing protein [Pseudobacteriovorax antillogorgiicola]TCS44584.1 MaoC dehydratase-like protein [Pseudobacteriovorax antillogorgiicola]SMF78047.1 MaoC like domain-containing protein [Pseudobacteriovorax antillogorgiicola]